MPMEKFIAKSIWVHPQNEPPESSGSPGVRFAGTGSPFPVVSIEPFADIVCNDACCDRQ